MAWLFVLGASLACALGNFWFTYGIWPRSWWSFAFFALLSTVLHQVIVHLRTDDRR